MGIKIHVFHVATEYYQKTCKTSSLIFLPRSQRSTKSNGQVKNLLKFENQTLFYLQNNYLLDV